MTIGTFTLVKNEAKWIGPHIVRLLPHVDQMVFFDGNSNDGTLEIIKHIRDSYKNGSKITLVEGRDPENLEDAYTRMFNECMWTLKTDWAWFLHPDMYWVNPGPISFPDHAIAGITHFESFAGNPGEMLFKISGRSEMWKNIYRLRNPDLGAHYFGNYGAQNEDVYFSDITGDEHVHYGPDFEKYPYPIHDSGKKFLHFSDVRDYDRRLSRMKKCLMNQGLSKEQADELAPQHPRVTLKDGGGFTFEPAKYPLDFLEVNKEFESLVRAPIHA